jgi:hypothetical protein
VEPGSPFKGERQLGQVPLHRIKLGLMPPSLIKFGLGGFTCLSRVILVQNSHGSMPAHMKGCEGNLLIET